MGLFVIDTSEVPTKESITKVIIANLEIFLKNEDYDYLVTGFAKTQLEELIHMIELEKNEN